MSDTEGLGYSARTRLTEEEIEQKVDAVSAANAGLLLRSLVDLLYGPEADENWGADTLDELAQLLHNYDLTP